MHVLDNSIAKAARTVLEYAGFGHRIAPFPIRRQARPWRIRDLPAAQGLEAGPPDYVGIGCQKAGTSWWAGLIEQHPAVAPNLFARKEMHFLTHFFDRSMTPDDADTYHQAFCRPRGMLAGEWTPNYIASPYTIIRLNEAAPDARVLVMFRDPVARFESGFNHEFKNRFTGVIGPKVRSMVIKAYALRQEAIWMGMYAAQMEVVLRHVQRERLLVLQFERCQMEPVRMIAQTYRFLGIDNSFQPTGINQAVNPQRRVVAPLGNEARRVLADIYADDGQRLAKMFPKEIDISLWQIQQNKQPSAEPATESNRR